MEIKFVQPYYYEANIWNLQSSGVERGIQGRGIHPRLTFYLFINYIMM